MFQKSPSSKENQKKKNQSIKLEHKINVRIKWNLPVPGTNLLSFRTAIIPAASAGETCDGDCGRSVGLCELKLLEEVLPGVPGREELGELSTEGGYQDCGEPSCGRG
jgi:hypothetical protein